MDRKSNHNSMNSRDSSIGRVNHTISELFPTFFRFQIARIREGPKVKEKSGFGKKGYSFIDSFLFNRLNIRITIILQLIFLYTFALIINYRANWLIICFTSQILFYIKKSMIAILIYIAINDMFLNI